MSALQYTRSNFQGHGAGVTTVSVQGLQEDLQRNNRHSFTGPSQEGQVARLWRLPRRWADGSKGCRALQFSGLDLVSLATSVFGHTGPAPPKLTGIVEVDETYVPESQKGNRNLDRKAHRRGGKASKRGLSDEQVPILVAVDRSGTTTCSVLPSVTADNVQAVLEPRIDDDILLVTEGNNVYPPCAKSLGIKHEALNQSAGERVRGAIHIQTVNNRHSRFKDFLHRFRGVSTKYLGNYLRWFERRDILKSSPRSNLATAIGGPGARFAN